MFGLYYLILQLVSNRVDSGKFRVLLSIPIVAKIGSYFANVNKQSLLRLSLQPASRYIALGRLHAPSHVV